VRDAIESLHELPGLTETGKLLFSRATLKIYDRPTLRAVIQGIHSLDLAAHNGQDFKGDMYEYLLSKLSASGTNGQFRTPRHIIDLITALVDPQPGQRICDPACGTAGFLISAFAHILRQHTKPADLKRGGMRRRSYSYVAPKIVPPRQPTATTRASHKGVTIGRDLTVRPRWWLRVPKAPPLKYEQLRAELD